MPPPAVVLLLDGEVHEEEAQEEQQLSVDTMTAAIPGFMGLSPSSKKALVAKIASALRTELHAKIKSFVAARREESASAS